MRLTNHISTFLNYLCCSVLASALCACNASGLDSTGISTGEAQPGWSGLPALPGSQGMAVKAAAMVAPQAHPGDESYTYSANTVMDATAHTALLQAGSGEVSWAMYGFTGQSDSDRPLRLGLSLSNPLPARIYLGVSNYTRHCWHWLAIDAPAADNSLLLPEGYNAVNSGGSMYIVLLAYDSAAATIKGVELAPGCAVQTFGYGCGLDGHAALYDGLQLAWGDLHSHTSYSADAVNYNGCAITPGEACAWARDMADLDFVAITDHAEDGAPGEYTQEKWDNMLNQEQNLATLYPSDDTIVVFPGFEYTKCSFGALPEGNGHRNIICRDFSSVPGRGWGFDTYDLPTQLWEYLDASAAAGNYICIPHHPAKGSDKENPIISMKTDWSIDFIAAAIQPLVEIYSRHGSSESMLADEERVNDFDGTCSVEAVLGRWLADHNPGYKLGILASTDTHDGNPGGVAEVDENTDDRLGSMTGGLAAVWTPVINREAIWDNLLAKKCYGTSGSRTRLEFTLAIGESTVPMGSTVLHNTAFSDNAYAQANLHIFAESPTGEPVARIQIFKNAQLLADVSDPQWTSQAHLDYQDLLAVDYAYYRIKVWVQKESNPLLDNVEYERAWSSPIWVELDD